MILPLLNAAQSAAKVAHLDRSLLASACAILGSAVTVTWRPQWRAAANVIRHRGARRRFAAGMMISLMFLAMLPSVLPLDHVVSRHQESQGHDEVHAAHCHTSPGSCSEMPLQSGPGQFPVRDPLIVAPVLIVILLVMTFPLLFGFRHRPEVPPPRGMIAFS